MLKVFTLTICQLFTFWTVFMPLGLASTKKAKINLKRFKKPFCMIGNGRYNVSFRKKLKTMRRYQRKISRRYRKFRHNRRLEDKATLHGSPKWVAIKYLRSRGLSWQEVDFAFFALTLFAEARNLNEKDATMVAKVINNRKKNKSYRQAVSQLGQFSSWYYRNQLDNTIMLCPSKKYHKHWKKILKVASENFNKADSTFQSTHYFAPYNMVPRYRIPNWAKGSYAVGFGGHIFLVDKDYKRNNKNADVIYIPKKSRRIKIVKGKIKIIS